MSQTSVPRKPPTIMVSSCVYGMEELLDQVFGLLTSAGYEVWMSHKGTIPVDPGKSNFENCIAAVRNCDLFLGILTTRYGSGQDKKADSLSIMHREVKEAIKPSNHKPRWFLAHDELVFARGFLAELGFKTSEQRHTLTLSRGKLVENLRVFDMYDSVIQAGKKLKNRRGNWAQKYHDNRDALIFVQAQFFYYRDVLSFIESEVIPYQSKKDTSA